MVRCCKCCQNNDDSAYSENGIVSERHYGCYRLGILVALAIVIILIIGTVPVFFTTDNSKLILIVTIISVILVGVFVFIFFEWQHRQALNQRERCREEWNVRTRTSEQQFRNNRRNTYSDTLNETAVVIWKTKKQPTLPNPSSQTSSSSTTTISSPPRYSQV